MVRSIGVLAILALAATGCVADPPAAQQVSKSHAAETLGKAAVPADLNGKTVQLTYDSGSGGTITFSADGRTLTYTSAGTGRQTSTPVAVEPIEAGIFLVTWTDDTGAVVSQVQDYRTGKVEGTWTRHDAAGQAVFETRTGSVHFTD
ncbi:MoaF-related domain-containing protein [Nocardia yunnanensis]|uniref:MoaF-related domain-containing protein n=1 Tax=Nocardia yunnanensis TaxID=2382165 RepID=UPI0013C5263A|nr:MoaF N-terminal domain-containing protein [Nocardia yunnanensis]